jgi:hypothetical protein
MYERIERALGGPSPAIKALAFAALGAAKYTQFRQKHESLMQPNTRVNRYNWDHVPVVERATSRLPMALRSVLS